MSLTQIIYSSKPFGFDASVLDDILTISRVLNARNDITGTLICRADMYLQLIEGPDEAIQATYARIIGDDRHLEINLLVSRQITERMFPKWAMRDNLRAAGCGLRPRCRLALFRQQRLPKFSPFLNGSQRDLLNSRGRVPNRAAGIFRASLTTRYRQKRRWRP